MRMEVQPAKESRDLNLAAISMAGVGGVAMTEGRGWVGRGMLSSKKEKGRQCSESVL